MVCSFLNNPGNPLFGTHYLYHPHSPFFPQAKKVFSDTGKLDRQRPPHVPGRKATDMTGIFDVMQDAGVLRIYTIFMLTDDIMPTLPAYMFVRSAATPLNNWLKNLIS